MSAVIFRLFLIVLVAGSAGQTMAKTAKAKAVKPKTAAAKAKAEPSPDDFLNVIIVPGASQVPVRAKQAILIDYNSGRVLLEKNADESMSPSSMTKMMTTYIVEEKLKSGEITDQTEFLVSERAWRTQGSKMFVQVGNKVSVADLHKGIAIQSGNDASIVAAEGLFGSESAFAIEMNNMAKKLGMTASQFKNAHGLHEEGHYSTARDLAKLAQATVKDHSQYYNVNSIKEFTYNGIKQGNRNPLLYDNLNCDGIKTGHTDAGGFGVTASCLDGDQRYILVINGLPSVQARADEARHLMGWAKANFIGKLVLKKGDVVEKAAKVDTGIKETIPLVASEDLYMLMLRSEQNQIQLKNNVTTPLMAPVTAGQHAGTVTAEVGATRVEVALLTAESVERLGWFRRLLKYFGII